MKGQAGAKKKKSQLSMVWKRLKKNKTAVAGLVILASLCVLILSAGFLFDYDTDVIRQNAGERLRPPSKEHWMGTDEAGRDIIRLWYIERKSKDEIAAAVNYASATSVYDLRNKAVAEFALRYFGAGALPSV